MKKNIFIILLLAFFSVNVVAKDGYTKEERKIIRVLKKQCRIDDVDFLQAGDLRYILIYDKKGNAIVANADGKIIIPSGYFDYWGNLEINLSEQENLDGKYNPGNKTTFCIKRKGQNLFFDADGNLLAIIDGELKNHDRMNFYYHITENGQRIGLVAKDGRTLLEPKYTNVDVCDDGICFVTSKTNGVNLVGAYSLAESILPNVPCSFNEVVLSENRNEWLVRVHEFDSLESYNPDSLYARTYKDFGMELFAQHKYEKCREFYSIVGDDIAWANFYIGASYMKEIEILMSENEKDIHKLEISDNILDAYKIEHISHKFNKVRDNIQKASSAFEDYLKVDSSYLNATEKQLYRLSLLGDEIIELEIFFNGVITSYHARCEERSRLQIQEQQRLMEEEKLRIQQRQLELEKEQLRLENERQRKERERLRLENERQKYERERYFIEKERTRQQQAKKGNKPTSSRVNNQPATRKNTTSAPSSTNRTNNHPPSRQTNTGRIGNGVPTQSVNSTQTEPKKHREMQKQRYVSAEEIDKKK